MTTTLARPGTGAASPATARPAAPDDAHTPTRRPPRLPRRAVEAALVVLAHLPLVFLFVPLFDGSGYVAPLTSAVLFAGAVGWFAARRLVGLSLVCLVGLAAGLAYATVLTAAAGGSPVAVLRALRDGWPRLLGVALPARPEVLLLVPVGAVLWIATYTAIVLAARTSHPLLPALPPMLGLGAALPIVGRIGGTTRMTGLLLTAAAVVLLLAAAVLRAARTDAGGGPAAEEPAGDVGEGAAPGPAAEGTARSRLGSAASFGLLIVGTVALVGLAAGLLVPVSASFDPRDRYHPAMTDVDLLNPLGRVRTQLEANPRTVFTVRFDTSSSKPPTDRVAVGELGDFDGATWSDDDRFVLVDHTLPTVSTTPVSTVRQTAVRAQITLGSLDSTLLPALGRPQTVTATGWSGMAYDPVSGALVALSPPAADARYTLGAQVPAPTKSQLDQAVAATGPAATPYLRLPPGMPATLTTLANTLTAKATTPYGKLTALAAALANDQAFPYDLNASPGHSYGVLARFLTGTDAGDQRGYAEQHAAAFAVLARALGVPTRISVGYLLDTNHSAADGTFTVTTRQAHAWPEVLLAGIGWVAFEPTDVSQLTKVLPPPSSTATGGTQQGQTVSSAAQPPIVAPQIDHSADQGAHGGGSGGGGFLRGPLLAALLVVIVLVAVPLLIVAAKRVRSIRRRRGSPAARVDGAWREARDRLGERGVPRDPSWTHREVYQAVLARAELAAALEPLGQLIALADAAMFTVSGDVGDTEAQAAWQLVGELRRALRGGGARARLSAALGPATLFPPRGSAPAPAVPLAARALLTTPVRPASPLQERRSYPAPDAGTPARGPEAPWPDVLDGRAHEETRVRATGWHGAPAAQDQDR
jgi:hypothetical protein